MALDILRITFTVALVLVIPGLLLVRALWPDSRAPGAPGPVLGGFYAIVLSIALTIVVSIVLGFMPHEEGSRGWLQTSATGAPIAESVLILLSAVFLAVGYWRGAYPWLSREARQARRSSPD